MTTVRARIESDTATDALRRTAAEAVGSPATINKIAQALDELIRGTFRNETDPWGQPWAPLKDSTLTARQRRENFSVQMLIDTGTMYSTLSITPVPAESAVEAEIGRGAPYAEFHQFGHEGGLFPARSTFPMRSRDEVAFPGDWLREVFAPLREAVEGAAR